MKKYKINKKPLIIVLAISILIAFLLANWEFINYEIKSIYLNTWNNYNFEEYDLSFSLPKAYKVVEKPTEDSTLQLGTSKISSLVDISGDTLSKLQKPERVFSGGNILTGVSVAVNCFKTSKTTKPLEEVAESYCLLIPYFYEEKYEASECVTENLSKENVDIIQISCDMIDDEENKTIVMYLMSFDDKEVTITFFGDTLKINSEIDNLKKIVSKVK